MELLLIEVFCNIKSYNKYMTEEYYNNLSFNEKLCFCHPDDRVLFERKYKQLKID